MTNRSASLITCGASIRATRGSDGDVRVPSMNQLMLSRATASEAGLFFMVEKNWTTLLRDMPTTINKAATRGMQGSSASQMIIPTMRDMIELKRLRERATTLCRSNISSTIESLDNFWGEYWYGVRGGLKVDCSWDLTLSTSPHESPGVGISGRIISLPLKPVLHEGTP